MLASTVQFSTNDHPTTLQETPSPPHGRYVSQVMPGTEIPTSPRGITPPAGPPTIRPARLFFQDPTGCYLLSPSPAAPTHHVPRHQVAVLAGPAVAGSDWPVSPPSSTPT